MTKSIKEIRQALNEAHNEEVNESIAGLAFAGFAALFTVSALANHFSKLAVGDKVYFKGDKSKVGEVIQVDRKQALVRWPNGAETEHARSGDKDMVRREGKKFF